MGGNLTPAQFTARVVPARCLLHIERKIMFSVLLPELMGSFLQLSCADRLRHDNCRDQSSRYPAWPEKELKKKIKSLGNRCLPRGTAARIAALREATGGAEL